MNKKLCVAFAACAGLLASPGWAETSLNLSLPDSMQTGSTQTDSLLLALNETDAAKPKRKSPQELHVNFEEPSFSPEKFHQYLGLTTLGLVALAAISPKEEDSAHEYFATAAAVTAGATVANGLIFHWEDFHFEDGFTDPDNMHMMLGTLGAVLMAAAVSQAPEGGHAGLGIGGGIAMATAVKITW